MLNFIRERAQGWLAWIIIGLLIIPFALWGINEYFGGGSSVNVATVNGEEITQREFQEAFFDQRTRMQQMFGAQYDARLFDEQIRQGVLEELVNRELIRQYAEEHGYRVSEIMVANTIRNLDAFQEAGVFSTDLYEQHVRSQGLSPAGFEQRLILAMLVGQIPEGLVNTAFVTKTEIDQAIRLQEQKRDIEYLVLPIDKYRDESLADSSAIESYYKDNAQRFMSKEQVRVEYIELAASQLGADDIPDEATLRDFFDSRANEFRVPEERKASHILIEVANDADEAAVTEARREAENILAKIQAGEVFADLAKAESDDIGSAQAGGDLGYFGRGVMDPAFEEAAFALQEGEVSDLVRTSFGFHIIKLEDIRESTGKSFDDVRAELLAEYQRDIAEREYLELADELTNLAFETPDSLREVAEQLDLELKQSEFFGRDGGKGVLADPRVVNVAFSNDVLQQGYNSEPVEVGRNHIVVLRLLEHREARQQDLEDVRDQVKSLMIDEAAREAVQQAANENLEQLKQGVSHQTMAQSVGVEWKTVNDLQRESSTVEPMIGNEAFRIPRPQDGKANYSSVVLANGDVALIRLTNVTDGDPASYDQASRETLQRRLSGESGSNAERRLLEALRAEADVVLNTEDL